MSELEDRLAAAEKLVAAMRAALEAVQSDVDNLDMMPINSRNRTQTVFDLVYSALADSKEIASHYFHEDRIKRIVDLCQDSGNFFPDDPWSDHRSVPAGDIVIKDLKSVKLGK
jgi:hypothetical protein